MRRSLLTGVLTIACVVTACNPGNKHEVAGETSSDALQMELEQQGKAMVGKTLSLKGIADDTVHAAGKTLLLYTGYDCGNCIQAAFKIVNGLDSVRANSCVVVECSANKGMDQFLNQYKKYIYTDTKDVIRRTLKYVKTPVLLRLNETGKITSFYFPSPGDHLTPQVLAKFN